MKKIIAPILASVALLAACNGGEQLPAGSSTSSILVMGESAPTIAVTESRSGEVYRQEVAVEATGDTAVIQVMEPTMLVAGEVYPLVLQGHGYGGSRNVEPSGFQQRLRDSGYYVISIDQRGAGESSGTVRVMDPEFEGQALIAILDWAENLPGLRRRGNGEMYVGSYGGSYGGMFQLLLYAADPRHRLRVLAPDVTPHDLTYALNPHDVLKSGYGLALVAGGEASVTGALLGGDPAVLISDAVELVNRGGARQDPAIFEILLNAALSNEFSEAGFNFMRYHSMKYFCDGEPAGPQDFLYALPDQLSVPPDAPPPADVMISQGFRDTLFNFNDGLANYECLSGLGGDVRLLTHESGHILPVSAQTIGLEDPLDPFYQALTLPNFQDPGGSRNCGDIDLDEARFAWFEEKLQGRRGAINAVLSSGQQICLSLSEGDTILVDRVLKGGTAFDLDASIPQFNAALGVAGAVLGNGAREALLANQLLLTAGDAGAVLAGVPRLDIEIAGLSGAEMAECALPAPLPQAACDPVLFLALGRRAAGAERWDVIDDQITPVRGFGAHQLDMNGVGERLQPGDELALLIYGFHAQFPVTWARDLLVPAVTLSGRVDVPLLD